MHHDELSHSCRLPDFLEFRAVFLAPPFVIPDPAWTEADFVAVGIEETQLCT